MIELPRCLARQFRAMLRRCLKPPGPHQTPIIRLHVGSHGLEMSAGQQECVIVYQQPGKGPSETLLFPADVLADIQGKEGSVTLERTGEGKGVVRWEDAGIPGVRPFDSAAPQQKLELPEIPSRLEPLEPSFLPALAEATRTAARQSVRYALTRIQLRGRRGQLVATDGLQLLVQSGFALPWSEDVLIPALSLFASRDLPRDGPLAIGRTDKHVSLCIGPWSFHVTIDKSGRYPDIDSVLPKLDTMPSRLHLSEDDTRFLAQVLPRLAGHKDAASAVTLELGEQVVVRLRADPAPQISDIVLSGSSCQGPPVRIACNRHFLWRVVQLGFRDLLVRNASAPLVCRDETRTYLFMPVERALSPVADAVRIDSAHSPLVTGSVQYKPRPQRSPTIMPRAQTNGEEPRTRPAEVPSIPTSSRETEPPDLLVEADALRALLHDAQFRLGRLSAALKQQRRSNRALRAAVDSLRGLQLDR